MFTLVVPVYRNEASIPDLLQTVESIDRGMRGGFEVVFVVDGSPDRSFDLLQGGLDKAAFRSQLLLLSRNFGSFAAIRAGLEAGRGSSFGVMSADGQEPPELVLAFAERLRTGHFDVVIGSRTSRGDPLAIRAASRLFWSAYRCLVQRDVPAGGVDVFGCTAQVRNLILSMNEGNSTLVGLLLWLGFRREVVKYERLPRRHGKSGWSFGRRLRYMLDSVFAFSDLPIRLLSLCGLCGILLSLGLGILVLAMKAVGAIPIPGYAATVMVVMFFGGLNSLGLGLIGEYVWRAFENTKQRPGHVVAVKIEYSGKPEVQ